ncbi:hypothetical protein ACMFMG_010504 [Clarireedia jacksonii]
MRGILPITICLNFFFYGTVLAQDFSSETKSSVSTSTSSAQLLSAVPTPSPTSSSIELTPAMSSSSVASFFSALATTEPAAPDGPAAGDAGSSASSPGADSDAGASGTSSGSVQMSTGVMVAIIVAVVGVCLFGIISSVLYYLAKKRSWEVRKKIRASARRVAVALTPKRTTFGKDVHRRPSGRGLAKIDEVPPTPKNFRFGGSDDVEKADTKTTEFEMSEPPKQSKWARRMDR